MRWRTLTIRPSIAEPVYSTPAKSSTHAVPLSSPIASGSVWLSWSNSVPSICCGMRSSTTPMPPVVKRVKRSDAIRGSAQLPASYPPLGGSDTLVRLGTKGRSLYRPVADVGQERPTHRLRVVTLDGLHDRPCGRAGEGEGSFVAQRLAGRGGHGRVVAVDLGSRGRQG